MLLIDALYINNGGGKVLLDLLINKLESTDREIYYLLDYRVRDNVPSIKKTNKVFFYKASLLNRWLFYKKYSFSKIFCFGNLPPVSKTNAKVITYFHNPMYLDIPNGFSGIQRILYHLKIIVINLSKQNTNYWFVQSEYIQLKLQKKFNINSDSIQVYPFYKNFYLTNSQKRQRHSYIYVSNGTPHKNHENLINAFCKFYDRNKTGTLTLTINEDYPDLLKQIKEKTERGYPIINIGFVESSILVSHYEKSEYLIFPSLSESFGLGLIEAIECGCKVIAADLPYTFEVCDPSLTFNPHDQESILQAIEKGSKEELKNSIPKIKNRINDLLNILTEQ